MRVVCVQLEPTVSELGLTGYGQRLYASRRGLYAWGRRSRTSMRGENSLLPQFQPNGRFARARRLPLVAVGEFLSPGASEFVIDMANHRVHANDGTDTRAPPSRSRFAEPVCAVQLGANSMRREKVA